MFLLLAACGAITPATWDLPAPEVDCAPGRRPAPLLDDALADAELARDELRVTDEAWAAFDALVDGPSPERGPPTPLLLPWWTDVHHHPERVDCMRRQLDADLDVAAAAVHPVASTLTAWAGWVDHPLDPSDPVTADDPFGRLAAVTGAGTPDLDALDRRVADALGPVLSALADAIEVREAMVAAASPWRKPKALYDAAPGMVLSGFDQAPNLNDPADVDAFVRWVTAADGPPSLSDAARRVAFAVEDTDWTEIAGRDVDWRWATPMGEVIVAPPGATEHGNGAVLLLIELGGDDHYRGTAGANASASNGVSLVVDLGGDDVWDYPTRPADGDAPDGPPSDRDGRSDAGPSASVTGRQGSGRVGIGMVFDRGATSDRYTSLRASQGFGAFGVGVLADDGGDDRYLGEAGVQGAGVFGVGLLLDGGGDDTWHAWAFAQGFGYVRSGGLALDVAGDDVWRSDPGRDYGGATLYASAQLANGEGNSSFTQGAGFGLRGDGWRQWWPGGVGVLRDGGGDDQYTAGVFAQGTGYWQGTGVLSDAGGDDAYDALWYVQGGAAHFALGVLADGGGDDVYGGQIAPRNVSLGSGHDLSVGVFIDAAGDDTYALTSLAAGASNCQGIGIFADLDGSDTYVATSTSGVGWGSHSGECGPETGRTAFSSIGLFMDSGGDGDTWTWPADARAPADDARFGIEASGDEHEHGGAVDGDGEAGFGGR